MAKISKEQLYGLIEKGIVTFTGLLDNNGEVIDEKYLDTEYLLSQRLITHIHLLNIPIGTPKKPNSNQSGEPGKPDENKGGSKETEKENTNPGPINKVESTEESEESAPIAGGIQVEGEENKEEKEEKVKPGVISEEKEEKSEEN